MDCEAHFAVAAVKNGAVPRRLSGSLDVFIVVVKKLFEGTK